MEGDGKRNRDERSDKGQAQGDNKHKMADVKVIVENMVESITSQIIVAHPTELNNDSNVLQTPQMLAHDAFEESLPNLMTTINGLINSRIDKQNIIADKIKKFRVAHSEYDVELNAEFDAIKNPLKTVNDLDIQIENAKKEIEKKEIIIKRCELEKMKRDDSLKALRIMQTEGNHRTLKKQKLATQDYL